MSKKLIDLVKRKFTKEKALVDSHSRLGNDTIIIRPEHLLAVMEFLRDDPKSKMNLLRELTAVDYLHRIPRFEVVYVLYSLELKHMLIVRVLVDGDKPSVPTLGELWPIAGWMEREVWDMYGIKFEGHPDLRRVLLYEEFDGHPLRKDYPVQRSQPRIELRERERDAVEEFKEYVKGESTFGSRERFSAPSSSRAV
jgi:NADH-quinone oxidoreductase subunit C